MSLNPCSVSVADDRLYSVLAAPEPTTSTESAGSPRQMRFDERSDHSCCSWQATGVLLATLSEQRDYFVNDNSPIWLVSILHKLQELTRMPSNWDGYGSPPVDSADVRLAIAFLTFATADTPEPAVIPYEGGGLQLEWCAGETYLEAEMDSARQRVGVLVDRRGRGASEYVIPESELPVSVPAVFALLQRS